MVIYENRLMSLRQNQTETLGDAQFHEINEIEVCENSFTKLTEDPKLALTL